MVCLNTLNSSTMTTSTHFEPHILTSAPLRTLSRTEELAYAVLREEMPLRTLFRPELKLSIAKFVKDQLLLQKIAEYISKGRGQFENTKEGLRNYFREFPLLNEIVQGPQQEEFLDLFFTSCSEALDDSIPSETLDSAIRGRVFTIKNALVAQKNPQLIQSGQAASKKQTLDQIREEGKTFIRNALRLHLNIQTREAFSSFKAVLLQTAERLIPFIRQVTIAYLEENGKERDGDILAWRNPRGANQHGMVAAALMEGCLLSLGYNTELYVRSDLEPSITLAIEHSVVFVRGDDGGYYLVDCAYQQFHKDVTLSDDDIPKEPVLVLESHEIDEYIDTRLLPFWKRTSILAGEAAYEGVRIIQQKDQMLSFRTDPFRVNALTYTTQEEFVRASLKRVWDIATYTPVPSSQTALELFLGSNPVRMNTHKLIKGMEISSSAAPLLANVREELRKLMTLSPLRKNSPEAFSLLAKLPFEEGAQYAKLIHCDPRLHARYSDVVFGVELPLNAYLCSLKRVVNPEGRDLHVVYGCPGSDAMTPLISTDATKITMVDTTDVSYDEFARAVELMQEPRQKVLEHLSNDQGFLPIFYRYGGARSDLINGNGNKMQNLPLRTLFALDMMGVDADTISIKKAKDQLTLSFDWQYYSSRVSKKRSITFIKADITNPISYPTALTNQVENGFDVFYMKGSMLAAREYGKFLPYFASHLSSKGVIMATAYTFCMEYFSPSDCLTNAGISLTDLSTDDLRLTEEFLELHHHDPMKAAINARHNAPARLPITDARYWNIFEVRQV